MLERIEEEAKQASSFFLHRVNACNRLSARLFQQVACCFFCNEIHSSFLEERLLMMFYVMIIRKQNE